ncbi:ABC transporter substrate-binding protein [Alkaliphilus transvaalensis]|uniref:ABC transporter substrate-binding protein n=1 Tax=Alkaliphilus transvaalensis TaxID=114628 RepID=UPI000688F8D9|nr:ABC transporter substrate-binding protein [Alkaliphilus transvaalensis]
MKNKKLIYFYLALVMLLVSIPTNITYATSPSDWAINEVEKAVELDLITDQLLDNFQQDITREEFAQLAVKLYEALSGVKAPLAPSNPFIDTNNSEVLKAYELGIVGGISSNQFAPQQSITRQELSVMILRTIRAALPQTNNSTPITHTFEDENLIAPWALDAVRHLNQHGILGGVGENKINPRGNTTREQAIVLVLRSFNHFNESLNSLVVASIYTPISLDPHYTNDLASSRVMAQIYETLLNVDENMNLAPGLAESWRQVDSLTYEFSLKEGVKFHNGDILTAHDVAFTLTRATLSPYIGHIVGNIDANKIEVINDYTIRISTKIPDSSLLHNLTHVATSIVNKNVVKSLDEQYDDKPIGTGPFQLEAFDSDEVKLIAFDEYHGASPKSDRVIFKTFLDMSDLISALENGAVDIAFDLNNISNTNNIKMLEKVVSNPNLKLHRDMGLATNYVGLTSKDGPLNDIRVRQAINYAVNIEEVINYVYHNTLAAPKGVISPAVWGAYPDALSYDYNTSKGLELMKEAGYSDGLKLTMAVNYNQQRMDIAELLQSQLKEINIDLEIFVLEFGEFLDTTSRGEYDMFVLGWVTITADADYGLYSMFHSSAIGPAGNRTYYSNEKVDELLDLAREVSDPNKRMQYYHQAQEMIHEEAPWVVLGHGENISASTKGVTGFNQHPAGHHRLAGVGVMK